MRALKLFFALLALSSVGSAATVPNNAKRHHEKSGGPSYAPQKVTCPDGGVKIRDPTKQPTGSSHQTKGIYVSPEERDFVNARQKLISKDAMPKLLNNLKVNKDIVDKLTSDPSLLPVIGIAMSGGGYRALMNGAGFLKAAQADPSSSLIGGLLDSTTYLAGLSGAGWLINSIYINGFKKIADLQTWWNFETPLFDGPVKKFTKELKFEDHILKQVEQKTKTELSKGNHFKKTITDFWGRMLAYQLLQPDDGGLGVTFSSITSSPAWTSHTCPFPMLISDSRDPKQPDVLYTNTVYEINPIEVGSYDPTTSGFAPLQYAGSVFSNGQATECFTHFDQASYVLGTSSDLFNQIVKQKDKAESSAKKADHIPKWITALVLDGLDKTVDKWGWLVSKWHSNPFQGWAGGPQVDTSVKNSDTLFLCDGGEKSGNIPLNAMLVSGRNIDVIFAVDSSSDDAAGGYPSGKALLDALSRTKTPIGTAEKMPDIPQSEDAFIKAGLNKRPVIFGLEQNLSKGKAPDYPVLVYIPNQGQKITNATGHFDFDSNLKTFQTTYEEWVKNNMILNGFSTATMGNGTGLGLPADPKNAERAKSWQTCVGCAIINRSLARAGQPFPDSCKVCVTEFGWSK